MNQHHSSSSSLNPPSPGTSTSASSNSSNSNRHVLSNPNTHSSSSTPLLPRSSANPNQHVSINIPPGPNHSSIYNSQAHQATRFSNPPHQLSDASPPPSSSLPTHLGSWSSHLDLLNFGSVPSSPILGMDSHGSPQTGALDHHLPSQPFSGSFASLLQRASHPSNPHHHQLTNMVNKPLAPSNSAYPSSQQQLSHLSGFTQHALQTHSPLETQLHPLLTPSQSSISSSSRMLSSLMSSQSRSSPSSSSTADGRSGIPTSEAHNYPSLLHHSSLSETLRRTSFLHEQTPKWDPARLAPAENRPQPALKLSEDAIYVSRGPSSNQVRKFSSEWSNNPPSSERLPWALRDSTSLLGSPTSATQSPSSPYSSWSSLTPVDEGPMYACRSTSNLRNRDHIASQLWQLYGPGDPRAPSNDTLENLVRRLTGLGLDADQIRQRLNSHEWKDSLMKKEIVSSGWSASKPPNQNHSVTSDSASGSSVEKSNQTTVTTTHVQLSKINENLQEPSSKSESLKSPLFSREPSIERGRNLGSTRRTTCNLAGRWQETNRFNPNSMAFDMDWSAQSRSRSRHQDANQMDWRQDSRSRSARQEFRNDLMLLGHLSEGVSNFSNTNIPQRHKSCTESSQPHLISLFPELGNLPSTPEVPSADEITNNVTVQNGLIEQLIGSYHAQQSEETRLQSLSEKDSDHLSLQSSGPSTFSHGFFQPSSIPLSECEFGPWHLPIKPSQHSLLGSVPGLTQDFANLANAHAEYGYIPRLVRKTSFDEILAQQHHQKRGLNPIERSPSRPQNSSCSTADSLVRPNTATDPRDRLNLSATNLGKECEDRYEPLHPSFSAESTTQANYFELLSSTLSHNNSSELEYKSDFQPLRLNQNSISSDDLSFRNSENLLQPIFSNDRTSFVDRITPYDILNQLSQFDKTPVPQDTHSEWLQDSVAPTAVQPTSENSTKKTEESRLTRSPSSSSSSSEVSSKSSAALQIDTAKGEQRVKKEDLLDQVQTTIGFSGGRSSHMSSIGEARKRTKQLPYSSGDAANSNNLPASTSNVGQPRSTHCLNCQTTETPLWRRDSEGRPLCNACGLFVNLHGTPRPAALSKGVIKRRNRGKNREKNSNNPNPVKTQTFSKNLSVGGGQQKSANQNYSGDQTGNNVHTSNYPPSTS